MARVQFDSFADFIAMGGDGFHVWAAYGFFALVLVYNLWQPVLARRKFLKQQSRQERIQQQRGQTGQEKT